MNNDEFLERIKESFKLYLTVGTSRSTAKLKPLHGSVAEDIQKMLGPEFEVVAQGFKEDKEGEIEGRYYPKKVDITVFRKGVPVAGYAVKFVMRNYSQNSNNYFENMLGETANIRCQQIPYFQIFIVFEKVPYYAEGGKLKKYEMISEHHLKKYSVLSRDECKMFFHTPNKTLITLLKLKYDADVRTSKEYSEFYLEKINDNELISYSEQKLKDLGNGVIFNNYEDFIKRTCYIILGNLKENDSN